jgi:hypothetical protein
LHYRPAFAHPKTGQYAVAILTSLPVNLILRTVWNDLREVLVRLRGPFTIGISIVVFLAMIGSAPAISKNRLLSEGFGLLGALAILPFTIAVYRLLILDEATSGYPFAISTVRFRRMLRWTVTLWMLSSLPTFLGALAPSTGTELVSGFIVVVIGIAVMVRLAILLPAIAVDAPGASVQNVLADTRGHAWLIVKAYLTVALPSFLILLLTVMLAILAGAGEAMARGIAGSNMVFGALGFVLICPAAIVSARLFMSLGDRVKGEPTDVRAESERES